MARSLKYDPDKIREAREERGLTQSTAAGMMEATKQQWQMWESGQVAPGAHVIARLCKVLKKSPSYFFEKGVVVDTAERDPIYAKEER